MYQLTEKELKKAFWSYIQKHGTIVNNSNIDYVVEQAKKEYRENFLKAPRNHDAIEVIENNQWCRIEYSKETDSYGVLEVACDGSSRMFNVNDPKEYLKW